MATDPIGCAAVADRLDQLDATLAQLVDNTTGTPTQRVAGTVALSADDRDRLDLVWYGVWLAAGLALVALISPMFVRSFRFWQ